MAFRQQLRQVRSWLLVCLALLALLAGSFVWRTGNQDVELQQVPGPDELSQDDFVEVDSPYQATSRTLTASPTYAALASSWSRILSASSEDVLPERLEDELRWLAACLTDSGAIALTPSHQRVVPYFANYAAMTLVRWDPQAVRSYLDWYLANLNQPDRFGLSGTIYDYLLRDGREISESDYDSADSYAATFLTLVGRYVFATGDGQFVLDNLRDLHLIAGVCLELQDPRDNLVWAKADQRYKFLMDNCEVQLGLDTWGEVLRTLGLWTDASPYAAAAVRIREAIESELWQETNGSYAWGKTAWGLRAQRSRWYPDTVGQLYPALFGVIDPGGDRAQKLLADLWTAYPRWQDIGTGDRFPWALVAYAGVLGGDPGPAEAFVETVQGRFILTGRAWPWYSMEAAFYIDTLAELSSPGSSFPRRR
jgi:hypothetical protein